MKILRMAAPKELQFLGFSPEQIFIAKSLSMLSSIIISNFF